MRIEFNYKKEHFVQVFPLLYVTNGNEKAILLGLSYTNIAFVFGSNKNNKEYSKYGGQINNDKGDLKEYAFIWYKKMQNGNKTHYSEPFRTVVKASSRKEAVEQVTQFALKKMILIVTEESKFNKTPYGRVRENFEYINKMMSEIENSMDSISNTFSKFKN